MITVFLRNIPIGAYTFALALKNNQVTCYFSLVYSSLFTYGAYTSALALKNNQVNLLFLARLFVYSRKI